MTPREISKERRINIICTARIGQEESAKEVLHRTYSSTALKGTSLGICPVV